MRLQCLFTEALASASPALSENAPVPDSDATEEIARKGVYEFPFISTQGPRLDRRVRRARDRILIEEMTDE